MALILTAQVGHGWASTNEKVPAGIIIACSVFCADANLMYGSTLFTVELTSGPITDSGQLHTIIHGYADRTKPLAWHGLIEIDTASYIRFNAYGNLNTTARMNFKRLAIPASGYIQEYLSYVNRPQPTA